MYIPEFVHHVLTQALQRAVRRAEALLAALYLAAIVIWALQPGWMTRQPLFPAVLWMFAASLALGLLAGQRRALAAPVLCGLCVGVISAVTTNGDLGRGGELALGVAWGIAMGVAMAVGIGLRQLVQAK